MGLQLSSTCLVSTGLTVILVTSGTQCLPYKQLLPSSLPSSFSSWKASRRLRRRHLERVAAARMVNTNRKALVTLRNTARRGKDCVLLESSGREPRSFQFIIVSRDQMMNNLGRVSKFFCSVFHSSSWSSLCPLSFYYRNDT